MNELPPARINLGFVGFCAAVTGIGGFLFGYDTAVINGANTFLQQRFQLDPQADSWLIGLATAAAIIGCIPGAMSAGFLSDRFGRRRVLFLCAILYAVSGVLSAIPQTMSQFVAARILSGVAIGVSSMICPVYIAEIAPPSWRGRLGALFQLGIVTGIFLTLFINAKIQSLGDAQWNIQYGWRWMLAAEALPAMFFLFMLIPIPESPKWLIAAGREEEARPPLEKIGGPAYAASEIAAVRDVLQQEEGSFAEIFSPAYRLPLLISVVIMFAAQFSGINVIIYYSTPIFEAATGKADAGFQASVWIGLVNLLFTFVAIFCVDKLGRKPLMLVGNVVQAVALFSVGYLYSVNPQSPQLLWFVILYIAAFATAMGPIPWILCSEIFPAKLRGRAMSVSTFAIWTANYLVIQSFPYLNKALGPSRTFWLYAGCSAAAFFFVLLVIPETKGRSLEEIEKSWRRHSV
ncbi:MAG: sugar porter family MFS transporter [Pirellulales bacterium]|nr:sugar porter family MFS transporter [Pirellulales bacterium]